MLLFSEERTSPVVEEKTHLVLLFARPARVRSVVICVGSKDIFFVLFLSRRLLSLRSQPHHSARDIVYRLLVAHSAETANPLSPAPRNQHREYD